MIKAISELQKTHKEIGEILEYLATAEDGIDSDYGEVLMDLRWTKNSLQHRLTTLRLKKER